MITSLMEQMSTMSKPIEDLLPEKPTARLRIYAYSIEDESHAGLLKVGQTTQNVKSRIEQQLKTALVKNYTIRSTSRRSGTTDRSSRTIRCGPA